MKIIAKFTTSDGKVTTATFDQVAAADEVGNLVRSLGGGLIVEDVGARTAGQHVGIGAANQEIVAVTTVEAVNARAAVQRVVVIAARRSQTS